MRVASRTKKLQKTNADNKKAIAITIYVSGVFLFGSLLAWPLWELIQNTSIQSWHPSITRASFGRITNRSFLITALLGIWPLSLYLKCATKNDFGLNITKKNFLKDFLGGYLLGLTSLIALALVLYFSELIIPREHISSGVILSAMLRGITTGIIVGLIEEIFFRGILTRVFSQASNFITAALASSFIYAAVHFIKGPSHIKYEQIHWYSGLIHLKNAFHLYSNPAVIGSFLTLFTVGIFLAALSLKRGNIALAVGTHAGWVCIIKVTQACTTKNINSPQKWLIGNYDNTTGYLAFAWLAIICTIAWQQLEKKNISHA